MEDLSIAGGVPNDKVRPFDPRKFHFSNNFSLDFLNWNYGDWYDIYCTNNGYSIPGGSEHRHRGDLYRRIYLLHNPVHPHGW